MSRRHSFLNDAERKRGIAEPRRKLRQGIFQAGRSIGRALGYGMCGHLVGRRRVKRVRIKSPLAELLAKPPTRMRIRMAFESEALHVSFAGVQREREVGQPQAQPGAVRQGMCGEAAKRAIPTQIGVAIVRLRRHIGPRGACEPLHGMVGLQAGLAQVSSIDVAKRSPGRIAHDVLLASVRRRRLHDPDQPRELFRIVAQRRRGAIIDDAALVHDDGALGEAERHAAVLLDQHNGKAGVAQLHEHGGERLDQHRREPFGRLVHQQHGRDW